MSLRDDHPRLVAAVFVAVLSILPSTVQSQSWRRATGRIRPIVALPSMERLTAEDSVSGSDLLIGAPMEDAPENIWDAGAVYVMPLPGHSTKIAAREDGPPQYRER